MILAPVHELWKSSVRPVLHASGLVSVLTFQRVPAAVAGNSKGLSIPSYSQQSESLVLCLLASFWTDEADSPAIIAVTKSLIASIEKETKAEGLYHRYKYLNYAALFQDPINSYGLSVKKRLKAVSRNMTRMGYFRPVCRVDSSFSHDFLR